jgi:hypothetical protein
MITCLTTPEELAGDEIEIAGAAYRHLFRARQGEETLGLDTIETTQGREDLVEAAGTGDGGGRRSGSFPQLGQVEVRDLANAVASVHRRLHEPEPLQVRGAVSPRSTGGASGLHHAIAPFPRTQDLGREAGQAGDCAEGIGQLDCIGLGARHRRILYRNIILSIFFSPWIGQARVNSTY